MIREYRQSDLAGVLEAWYLASPAAHPFLAPAFFVEEKIRIRDVYMPSARSWVYEMDGDVVGFVAMIGNEVGGLFVRPDRQRRGIGEALLDAVRDHYAVLEVEVFARNTIGQSFYSKYGFQAIRESIDAETGEAVIRLRYHVPP